MGIYGYLITYLLLLLTEGINIMYLQILITNLLTNY